MQHFPHTDCLWILHWSPPAHWIFILDVYTVFPIHPLSLHYSVAYASSHCHSITGLTHRQLLMLIFIATDNKPESGSVACSSSFRIGAHFVAALPTSILQWAQLTELKHPLANSLHHWVLSSHWKGLGKKSFLYKYYNPAHQTDFWSCYCKF